MAIPLLKIMARPPIKAMIRYVMGPSARAFLIFSADAFTILVPAVAAAAAAIESMSPVDSVDDMVGRRQGGQ